MMNRGRIIEDIPAQEKRRLTVEDFLGRFAQLRKEDQLTDEMLADLRAQYL
jgi:ABC-type uncharacterized transport system ATPase component